MNQEKCLSFTRVRAKGEPEFYDVAADIRKVLPSVLRMLDKTGSLADDSQEREASCYLNECFEVLMIRLAEDSRPVNDLLDEFVEAVYQVPGSLFSKWSRDAIWVLLMIYGLFVRRDISVDKQAYQQMNEYTRLCSLRHVLSPETYAKVCQELKQRELVKEPYAADCPNGVVINDTDKTVIQHIKDMAARYMPTKGDLTWDEKAELVDREFEAGRLPATEEGAAVALAYPTYVNHRLQVELK